MRTHLGFIETAFFIRTASLPIIYGLDVYQTHKCASSELPRGLINLIYSYNTDPDIDASDEISDQCLRANVN